MWEGGHGMFESGEKWCSGEGAYPGIQGEIKQLKRQYLIIGP